MACLLRSEHFYDALGSVAFLSLSLASLGYGSSYFARQILLTVLVCTWTLRLGGFLLYRVWLTGGDSRFDEAKHKPGKPASSTRLSCVNCRVDVLLQCSAVLLPHFLQLLFV